MKSLFTCITLLAFLPSFQSELHFKHQHVINKTAGNLFIITIDGFRWQEIFSGADSILINDENYTSDTATLKMLYWSPNVIERRKKLLPFLWTVIACHGQLYGNRTYDNKMNMANLYDISYPGYNEIFTGNTDPDVASNNKYHNPNINVLEYLDSKPGFSGKVAAYTSWDVFPYILNKNRNNMVINSGYDQIVDENLSIKQSLINQVQDEGINDKVATRYDQLTFLAAKEYIGKHQPKIFYLGLGETDEDAHQRRYDLYLQDANQVDRMIADLWHWVQITPGYKDNTTFLITTDHGRGSKTAKWTSHGAFITGSSQTWLAAIGPGIEPLGEIKSKEQLYGEQLAQTIAVLVGEKFDSNHNIAPAISF